MIHELIVGLLGFQLIGPALRFGINIHPEVAPITVHMENVEKHILEDEWESREYINLVWAEMMDFYRKNKRFKLKLSGKTAEYLKELQKEHMPEDTNVGIIQAWLDGYHDNYVCSRMIYRDALGRDSDNPKQTVLLPTYEEW